MTGWRSHRRALGGLAGRRLLLAAIVLTIPLAAGAQAAPSKRVQISPAEVPLREIIRAVVQVMANSEDPAVAGNGLVIGTDGCHVLTNFHVAFGKGRDARGGIVLFENPAVGREVNVGIDLNPVSREFDRVVKGTVIDFANYKANDRRLAKNDLALLKLDVCLGGGYGLINLDLPAARANVPQTSLSTLSLMRTSATKSALFYEATCASSSDTIIAGLFFQTCETEPGMSGSPIFRTESDGQFTLVGLSSGAWVIQGKPDLAFAIYSSKITPFVIERLGQDKVKVRSTD